MWTRSTIFPARLAALLAAVTFVIRPCGAQEEAPVMQEPGEPALEMELQESSEEHMRHELGVNDITAPSIAAVLSDLGSFQPVPIELIQANKREAVYANRMQTALHFGSLVADGFMLTVAERTQDVQDVGKALIRQSRALGVGDRLTSRSKSLFELSEAGNWVGMRKELVRTQADVEKTMLDLRDEEMAHMISLGGWLRGFQLAARSCSENFTPDRARILGQVDVIDYYLDRLATLHPRLKETEFARELTGRIHSLKDIAVEAPEGAPTREQTMRMSELADGAMAVALGPVDAAGNIID